MFNRKSSLDESLMDKTIRDLHAQLEVLSGDDPEYGKIVDQLVKLETLKKNTSFGVSPDTLVLAATNLAGILAVLHYERVHVIGSKALSFVGKLR